MAAPPSFLQPLPAETDATDGDIVTFQVKVSNDPHDPTAVSWWRCGESLRPSPGKRDIIDHGDGWHELVLSNVTEEDEGEYECRVENGRGHNSSFGSLYYYREGGPGTLTDVAMEGAALEGDGRQSGLLILIDDGSQTEESGSEKSNRKSMTVSEQMQGIIEDLTQSNTGSMTLEKDDIEEDQFNSDIEELDDDDLENRLLQNILGMSGQHKTVSEDTLVPEMPSPDLQVDVAVSEGASDPYGGAPRPAPPHKWSSNPNHSFKKRKERMKEQKEESVWPPEAGPFDVPADTLTTSVELPFATSTEEGAVKGSVRCPGTETPFDVADITEEAVEPGSLHSSPADGTTTVSVSPTKGAPSVASSQPRAYSRVDSTLTSVTDLSAVRESCQQHPSSGGGKMAFVKSTTTKSSSATYRQQDDGVTSISSVTTMDSSSSFQKISRTVDDLEESVSVSAKRTKVSSAYEADESSNRSVIHSESFLADVLMDQPHRGADVYVSIMDFRPMESDEEAVTMKEGQRVEIIDASRPRRWLVRILPMCPDETPKEGWVPACYLERSNSYDAGPIISEAEFDPKEMEAIQNREAVVKELVETEEDFAKDMQFVVENYYKRMESPNVPKEFRDRKGSVFGNFKDISDFHNNVLMEGIHYHAKEPTKLGKTFLRLERDFDMHANYCWNEARAQQLLREGSLREYFDAHSRSIDDDKLLSDHLKLPIQRLNDYQLLLKELIKYSSRLGEDTTDLQKALDFIHGINGRTKDLQYVLAMQGCRGDLLKIGKILKHEVFDVLEADGDQIFSERYVFLFKGRLFVTEKRTLQGKDTYHVTNLFKLQDVEVVENVEGDSLAIAFRSHKKSRPGFPITFRARSQEQKQEWCKEISSANQVVEDLGDLEPNIELKDKVEELTEPESKKPKVESLKRQKSSDSAPQTPTEDIKPPLARQESAKKKSKSGESSTPQTPTENNKPPKLSRQDSVRKKQPKSSESPTEEIAQPTLKRQDSIKKKTSAPQTPTEEVESSPLSRQDSKTQKSSTPEAPIEETVAPSLSRQDSTKKPSVPQTPTEEAQAPPLSRQDSTKKSSVPQTPTEEAQASPLSTQDSKKQKPSTTETPIEEAVAPLLSRQDSTKKSSVPQTPTDEAQASPLTRKDSKKKPSTPEEAQASPLSKQDPKKKPSVPETPTEEVQAQQLSSQDSKKKLDEKVKRQDSTGKKESAKDKPSDKKKGEDPIPKIIMSEDASGSDARMESVDLNEDNATLASESLRSDESVTPPPSGAYAKPSLPLPSVYRHLFILIPVLCAFYIVTEFLGLELWD